MTACQSGFSLATKRAKTLAVHDPKEDLAETTTSDNAPVKKIQINKLTTAKVSMNAFIHRHQLGSRLCMLVERTGARS